MNGHAHLHFFCCETPLEHDLKGVDVNGSLKLEPDPLWRALWLDGNGKGKGRRMSGVGGGRASERARR